MTRIALHFLQDQDVSRADSTTTSLLINHTAVKRDHHVLHVIPRAFPPLFYPPTHLCPQARRSNLPQARTVLPERQATPMPQTLLSAQLQMEATIKFWILGGFAAAFAITSIAFNLACALSLTDIEILLALRILQYVAFGLSLAALAALAYFCTLYVRKLKKEPWELTSSLWWIYTYGVAVASAALAVTGVALVWSVVRQQDLPKTIIGMLPMSILGVWFGMWGVTLILQVALYVALGLWTKKVLKANSIGRLDLDFGIRLPPMDEFRPDTQATERSFPSSEPTLHSPPRTPKSRVASTRRSSSTRVGPPSSSKTKRFRSSARSSMDVPAFPAGEAVSIDSAFDSWDTSSVHREVRTAIYSSPPTRSGLEPIPGSRSESPANGLDGPFLPSSPTMTSSSPHAASSETAEAIGWDPSSTLRQFSSSPPSSPPPNFSRPTSRPGSSQQRILAPAFGSSPPQASMQELIHPLFRHNSPEPPPVAAAGSMIMAAPSANQPINAEDFSQDTRREHRTLARNAQH